MAAPVGGTVIVIRPLLTACRIVDGQPGPMPQVYALRVPKARPAESPETVRAQARQAARDALRHLLAKASGDASDAIVLTDVRGQALQALGWPHLGLSISYEADIVLLALFAGGEVGVDIAAIDATHPSDELLRTAALYLPPNEVSVMPGCASPAASARAFLESWTRQEARLKCARQPLVEWSPALQAGIAGLHASAVELPDTVDPNSVATVAWRSAQRPSWS